MATAQQSPPSVTIPADPIAVVNALAERRHKILLTLTGEMKARVDDLVRRTGYDEGELINVALSLFKVGLDAVEEGRRIGIVDDDREMALDLTGFHKDDPAGEPI